jgi:hypothetical protein
MKRFDLPSSALPIRFRKVDPASFAQRLQHAGMVHKNVDERLSVHGDRFAGAARPIVPLVQDLELVHRGVELKKRSATHDPVSRSADMGTVSMPGMLQISAPAAAYRVATTCNDA